MQCRGKLRSHLGLLLLLLLGSDYAGGENKVEAQEVGKNTTRNVTASVSPVIKNEKASRDGRYFNLNSTPFIGSVDNLLKSMGRHNLLNDDKVLANTQQHQNVIKTNYVPGQLKSRSNSHSDWEIFEIPQSVQVVKPKQSVDIFENEHARDIKSNKNRLTMYTCEFDDFLIHTSTKIDCDSIQNNQKVDKSRKKKTSRGKTRSKLSKGHITQAQSRRQKLKRQRYANHNKQPYQRRGYNKGVKNVNRQRMQYQHAYMYSLPRYTRRKTFHP